MKIERSIESHERARAILLILKSSGPLPTGSIGKLIDPPMKGRRLRDSLLRLIKRGFVQRRYEQIFGPDFPFYQVAQKPAKRKKVAKYINCRPEELRQAYFSHREVIFNTQSAMLTRELKKLFPEATFIRNFELQTNEVARRILRISDSSNVLLPGLLMILPSIEHSKTISAAFEIEKYPKLEKSLRLKIKRYAQDTDIDGLVYLCDTNRLIDIFDYNFLSRIGRRTRRSDNPRDLFLTFSNALSGKLSTETLLINTKSETFSLRNWIMLIQTSKDEAPTKLHTQMSAGSG